MFFKLNKRSRINYWSCSKVADYIRGTKKPLALEWDQWSSWHEQAKTKHPIRYWIADEVLDFIQDIVNLPVDIYNTIEIYVRNRFIDKIHYLKTGLKPGDYYDLDYRIINALFNELVIFVESEQAHLMKAYKDREYKFKNGRCIKAGLDYLDWASNLKLNEDYGIHPDDSDYGKPTPQAENSKKILELYNWWKNRSYRDDAHDLFSKEKDGENYFVKIHELEQKYENEDTDMLIELIKIRTSLWT